jgi:hypothetical protein
LFEGAPEQLTGKMGGQTGLHLPGQFQHLFPSRDRETFRQDPAGEPCENLGPGGSERKDHATMVQVGQRTAQGVET